MTLFILVLGYGSYCIVKYLNKGGNNMADKTIVCKDCSNEFIFTEGEQAFYAEKGFENEPKRCPDCRRAKKNQSR